MEYLLRASNLLGTLVSNRLVYKVQCDKTNWEMLGFLPCTNQCNINT